MPVDFLTEEQKKNYGRFSEKPNGAQLARYFHLDENDLYFIFNRRGKQNQLGFALQLTSVRFLGTFISDFLSIPNNAQLFVAHQLSIRDISILEHYSKRKETRREHMILIKKQYGYHDFGTFPWSFYLNR